MAEKGTPKKDNITTDKTANAPIRRKEQVNEVKIVEPNPPEISPKDDRTCSKPDPDMRTSFYISEFVMDFLERRRKEKNTPQAPPALESPDSPIRSRSLSPVNNPQTDTQNSSSSPSSEYEVPEHHHSPASCSPPTASPKSPTHINIPLLLQTCMLEFFSEKQCLPNAQPLLSLLLSEDSDSDASSSENSSSSITDMFSYEGISPPLSSEAPPSPPASVTPNTNEPPSKRRSSSSLDFQWEHCDPKKLKSLLTDDDTSSAFISKKPLKPEDLPDLVPHELYPYLLNLSEIYEVPMETVIEAIRLDQESPFKEKTGLYPSRKGRATQKDAEEKTDLHQPNQEKATASNSDGIVIRDSGRSRKGGPYKNNPKSSNPG